MARFKLTIRNGPKVSRESYETLDEALEALREQVKLIRREGNLPEISALRTYEPARRVRARLEISAGGFLRSRDAGIDVMGDQSMVAFRGGVLRKPLEADGLDEAVAAVAGALRE